MPPPPPSFPCSSLPASLQRSSASSPLADPEVRRAFMLDAGGGGRRSLLSPGMTGMLGSADVAAAVAAMSAAAPEGGREAAAAGEDGAVGGGEAPPEAHERPPVRRQLTVPWIKSQLSGSSGAGSGSVPEAAATAASGGAGVAPPAAAAAPLRAQDEAVSLLQGMGEEEALARALELSFAEEAERRRREVAAGAGCLPRPEVAPWAEGGLPADTELGATAAAADGLPQSEDEQLAAAISESLRLAKGKGERRPDEAAEAEQLRAALAASLRSVGGASSDSGSSEADAAATSGGGAEGAGDSRSAEGAGGSGSTGQAAHASGSSARITAQANGISAQASNRTANNAGNGGSSSGGTTCSPSHDMSSPFRSGNSLATAAGGSGQRPQQGPRQQAAAEHAGRSFAELRGTTQELCAAVSDAIHEHGEDAIVDAVAEEMIAPEDSLQGLGGAGTGTLPSGAQQPLKEPQQ